MWKVLFILAAASAANSKILKGPVDFDLIKQGFEEYARTRLIPDYLKRNLANIDLTHMFRPDTDTSQFQEGGIVCTLCSILFDLLIEERQKHIDREFFIEIAETVCTIANIEPYPVCHGIVSLNVDIFLTMIDNYNVTSQRGCGLILQEMNCDKGDNYEWTIDIPPGFTRERPTPSEDKTFNILQISDFHFDPNYLPGKNGFCSEPLCCQADSNDPSDESSACGYWTEYEKADIPLHTVQELIRQVKTHDVDYIYYTGDIISHRVWSTSVANNSRDLSHIYGLFRESFSVPVYPILGNHEPNPLNVWAPEDESNPALAVNWLFELIAEEWSQWLPEEAQETILKGGFYTVSPQKGFRVIVLNSNVCYTYNWWLIAKDFDPYGQLSWLVKILLEAEANNESVHILSHIPTGSESCLKVWAREYRKIVDRFANTITGQFNGHTHKDEFHIFYNKSDSSQAVNVAWNGASVTTYQNSNPSYKIYQVNREVFTVEDYQEWTFNLTEANLNPNSLPEWYKLHSFKEDYEVEDLSPESVDGLVLKMAADHSFLDKYIIYKYRNGDGINKPCDENCQKKCLCEIVSTEFLDDEKCEELKELYDKKQ